MENEGPVTTAKAPRSKSNSAKLPRKPRKPVLDVLPLVTAAEPALAPSIVGSRAFYATNHLNLISILSCGYLKPRGGYAKYYHDLAERCPGLIPVVIDMISNRIVEEVSSEGPSIPVAIELDWRKLDQKFPSEAAAKADSQIVLLDSPVAATCFLAIHCRTEGEKSEILARDYEGVDYTWFDFRVSPEIFDGEAHDEFNSSHEFIARRFDYKAADRRTGMLALILSEADRIALDPEDLGFLLGLCSQGGVLLSGIDLNDFTVESGSTAERVL